MGFQLGQIDAVTAGLGAASQTPVLDISGAVKQAVSANGAQGTTSPVATTVTAMAPEMLDNLATDEVANIEAAVASGQLSEDQAQQMFDNGDISEAAMSAASGASASVTAANAAKDDFKKDANSKIDDMVASAKAKATSSVESAKKSISGTKIPTSVEELKNSNLKDVLKTQQTNSAAYKNNNCAASPYTECATCKWSKVCIDSDNSLKSLLGSLSFLDDYNNALARGDSNQASQMLDCPGKLRTMLGKDYGIMGSAAGVAASTLTITATAASGNSNLFSKVASAVEGGDLKAVARDEFRTMAGNCVESGSTIGNLTASCDKLGIKSSSLVDATLPSGLRAATNGNKSATDILGSAVDAKKLCGFNGTTTTSMSSILSGTKTINKNYSSTVKQSSSIASLMGLSNTPSDTHKEKLVTAVETAYANRK